MTAPLPLPALLADCRRLFLRNHEITIAIGAHAFEKMDKQRVRVNVDLYVPLAQSTPRGDRLDEVVDYDFVRHAIAALVAQGHIELQETLADAILERMLAHPQVRAVRVSTDKPDVYPDCETVGVEVFRIKDQA